MSKRVVNLYREVESGELWVDVHHSDFRGWSVGYRVGDDGEVLKMLHDVDQEVEKVADEVEVSKMTYIYNGVKLYKDIIGGEWLEDRGVKRLEEMCRFALESVADATDNDSSLVTKADDGETDSYGMVGQIGRYNIDLKISINEEFVEDSYNSKKGFAYYMEDLSNDLDVERYRLVNRLGEKILSSMEDIARENYRQGKNNEATIQFKGCGVIYMRDY